MSKDRTKIFACGEFHIHGKSSGLSLLLSAVFYVRILDNHPSPRYPKDVMG